MVMLCLSSLGIDALSSSMNCFTFKENNSQYIVKRIVTIMVAQSLIGLKAFVNKINVDDGNHRLLVSENLVAIDEFH